MNNLNFYDFMNKQLPVLLLLFASTGVGYIYIGYLYSSLLYELLWYMVNLLVSYWGYALYRDYADNSLTIKEKDIWLSRVRYFLFTYFSLWTIVFIIYTSKEHIELHYIALVTQFGAAVVASAILVSQRKLAIATVISLMIPIMIYFVLVNEFYSYLLAIFTFVLTGVLLYSSNNTYNYLVKSNSQAYNDYLTKLGNRRCFIEKLEDSIKAQKRNNQFTYLLLIDLDHFKTINDTLGHDIGDKLLIEVASRMKSIAMGNSAIVARLGGDEFCLLSSFYTTKEECFKDAKEISESLLESVKSSYNINENNLYISASIGISIIDKPSMKASIFIKEADIAMYEAKEKGRDGLILFTDELSQKIEYKLDVERLLHFALEKDEISLTYQPQINIKTNTISCEVLARWRNEKLGQVRPDFFISTSEQTGFIIELGYFILEESFKTLLEWDKKGVKLEQMSINISMKQIFHNSFIDDVEYLCKKYLNKSLQSKLMFEITETSVAEDIQLLHKSIESLKSLGIKISIDDFGTGYSSLSYISELDLDELKIDKAFIDKLETTDNGVKMVKSILDIAKNLNLDVVAEGVEEESQKDFLVKNGCDILQGYYYSKPLLKADFVKYTQEETQNFS